MTKKRKNTPEFPEKMYPIIWEIPHKDAGRLQIKGGFLRMSIGRLVVTKGYTITH
jgi:hypothetical protein